MPGQSYCSNRPSHFHIPLSLLLKFALEYTLNPGNRNPCDFLFIMVLILNDRFCFEQHVVSAFGGSGEVYSLYKTTFVVQKPLLNFAVLWTFRPFGKTLGNQTFDVFYVKF